MPLDVQGRDAAIYSLTDIRKWARYLRMTYGAGAIAEAERRVVAHSNEARRDVADLWKLVWMHLRGAEVTEETHRILRTKRSLKVKAANG